MYTIIVILSKCHVPANGSGAQKKGKISAMESLTFKLDDFEGPLDLLLHLISQNKMDLYNIPILELIEQYTSLIRGLQQSRLDVASEFIDMAAQLVQMKSYLLLPRSEEAERMKQELQGQLIEYSACKKIAARLGALQQQNYYAVRLPMQVELEKDYRLQHDKMLLPQALQALTGRRTRRTRPTQESFEPLVQAPFVSVGSRVVHVLRGMIKGRFAHLRELFDRSASRSETVATFLAVLELVRAGRLKISDEEKLSMDYHRHRKQESE